MAAAWTSAGNDYIVLRVNDVSTSAPQQRSGPMTRARERWRRFTRPARRGLAVWGVVAVVIAVPEIWGSFGNPWFYSISRTTGHLEDLWSGVRGIVVALIALAAVRALLYRPGLGEAPRPRARSVLAGRPIRRAGNGRLTIGKAGREEFSDRAAVSYLLVSAAIVAVAGWLASVPQDGQYWRGYVIYGLIAVFFVIIPNAVAYFGGRDFPFTTLFATVWQLERTRNIAAMIIAAGLAVLTFHLALYPWPAIHLTAG